MSNLNFKRVPVQSLKGRSLYYTALVLMNGEPWLTRIPGITWGGSMIVIMRQKPDDLRAIMAKVVGAAFRNYAVTTRPDGGEVVTYICPGLHGVVTSQSRSAEIDDRIEALCRLIVSRNKVSSIVDVPEELLSTGPSPCSRVDAGQSKLAALEAFDPAKVQDSQYALVCDYCGKTLDYMPWHGSGLLNGQMSRHIHACDECRDKLPHATSSIANLMVEASQRAFEQSYARYLTEGKANQAQESDRQYLPDLRADLENCRVGNDSYRTPIPKVDPVAAAYLGWRQCLEFIRSRFQ